MLSEGRVGVVLVSLVGRVLALGLAVFAATGCTSSPPGSRPAPDPPVSTRTGTSASASTPNAPTGTNAPRGTPNSPTSSPTATGYTPSLEDAPSDQPSWDPPGCQVSQRSSTPRACVFGVRTAPRLVVAVVGDSVVNEWIAGLVGAGRPRGWKIVTELHSRCPWSATMMINIGQTVPYTSCYDWGRAVLNDLLTTIKPDVVVTSDRPVLGTPDNPIRGPASRAQIGDGMATYWRILLAHHIAVVPIRESPEIGFDVPQCLAEKSVEDCTVPLGDTITPDAPTVIATREVGDAVHLVDMNSVICPAGRCTPVVGRIVKFRDTHHLTATYVESITPEFTAKLLATGAFG
jgi:SGNH domain (fused to AT3 domains)